MTLVTIILYVIWFVIEIVVAVSVTFNCLPIIGLDVTRSSVSRCRGRRAAAPSAADGPKLADTNATAIHVQQTEPVSIARYSIVLLPVLEEELTARRLLTSFRALSYRPLHQL